MKYQIILPQTPLLAQYLRFFWVLESDQPYIHRSMADGGVELIFHYRGRFDNISSTTPALEGLSGLQGPSDHFSRFKTDTGFGILGVYFYPYALPDIFGIPASELAGNYADLAEALGARGKSLEEYILNCKNNAERIQVLSAFIVEELNRRNKRVSDRAVQGAIKSVIQADGRLSISQLADDCGISRRQFERRFKQAAGFSPKVYARIVRFQSALGTFGKKDKSLTQIALDCGYYDQAHFIRDFKNFSGYTPFQWFYGDAEGKAYREVL
ncbi:MAG: helix-turn-helix transcriptional regulator [Bacteroidia bacterium]|nr:helix-turn-helix transcriptional regulator [Bacteroidia bacterium]